MSIKLPAKVTRCAGRVKLSAKKNAPEILLVTGILAGIATVVVACKETVKAADVVEQFKEDVADTKEAKRIHDMGGVIETDDGDVIRSEAADNFDDKAYRVNMFRAYRDLTWGLTKTYAPAIGLGIISLSCILSSHGILKKRELAAVATSTALRQAFDEYRARVRHELGDDVERDLYYGRRSVDHITGETFDESGNKITETQTYKIATRGSVYSRFYDESVEDWKKDGRLNWESLVSDMKYLNYKLIADGHLFLNDVYKQLGFPITCQGQMAGWLYDPADPDNTLFKFRGMESIEISHDGTILVVPGHLDDDWRALMNDFEKTILIDFVNIRENILEDLPRIDGKVAVV